MWGYLFSYDTINYMKIRNIDKKIKSVVDHLNRLNIPTSGSCEGHITHDAPAPWIKIVSENKSKNIKLRKVVQKLLKKFYKDRRVRSDVCIVIENGNVGFWIHNGGVIYKKWRKEIERRVEKIKRGEKAFEIISKTEKDERKKKLLLYQKEMKCFEKFLEKLLVISH